MGNQTDILLESGTGNLEILKFKVKGLLYAINVIKVKEILQIAEEEINPLPSQPESVRGVTNVRGDVITIIDLRKYLDSGEENEAKEDKNYMILTEFNQTRILFAVDGVIGINKISWKDIQEPNRLMGDLVNGVIKSDDKLINFLDFEKILSDVQPELALGLDEVKIDHSKKEEREKKKLILADDSPTIREILKETLYKAGYTNLKVFNDGQRALNYLKTLKEETEDVMDEVQGLITDIEMPQLDGHALIRKIRNDKQLKDLPTLIFSSLITDNLRHKGEEVGADEQISKPEMENLIDVLDELVLE
ncbi:chemotaxis protein [Halanaerobacter jeridensis]|uniref:Stage 0 sporulation protein A homolog n=1 Tax=Halanaerobacter jeridensis TaxID=706427 RepID=A0A938XQ82_9FIRM|nr:chemotaxis protein [Halanaerobacter jeridensis]MBM7555554.1 two-component system chemotaxis response regulator CheV [Halanaerobacter jeridensis]